MLLHKHGSIKDPVVSTSSQIQFGKENFSTVTLYSIVVELLERVLS